MAELKEIAVGIALFGGVIDFLTKRIPNWCTFGAMLMGMIAQFFWGAGLQGTGIALFAILVGFLLFFPLFVLGVMGAGDVKLLMAIGAWTNSGFCIRVAISSILVGAVFAAFEMAYRGRLLPFCRSLWFFAKSILMRDFSRPQLDIDRSRKFSFGPALSCAVLLVIYLEQNGILS